MFKFIHIADVHLGMHPDKDKVWSDDRAAEIEADVILMGKKNTDGVYDSDPNKNPNAKKFDKLAYIEVLQRGLQVMDSTATSLCMDNNIPIVVFNIDEHENLVRAARGEEIGTTVGGKRE